MTRSTIWASLAIVCALVPTLARADYNLPARVTSGTVEVESGSQVTVPAGHSLHRTFLFGLLPEGTKPQPILEGPQGDTYVLTKPGLYRMTRTADDHRFGWHSFVGASIKVVRTGPAIVVHHLRDLKR
jgi:hypothetical protein